MSHPNDELIQRFYAAFAAGDGATMAAAYTPDATFSDPVFTDLRAGEPGAMWRMLTGRATDLKIELHEHEAAEDSGSAHWIARYTFSTGRPVVNDIQARFRFADGLIADHVDDFDFRNWAKQALGPMGNLVAVLPPLRKKAHGQARGQLDEFIASEKGKSSA